ncbi:unnamed protein product, partial [Lota lota]
KGPVGISSSFYPGSCSGRIIEGGPLGEEGVRLCQSATRLTAAPGPRYIQSTESEGGRERATDCVRRTHLRGPTGAAWLLQTCGPKQRAGERRRREPGTSVRLKQRAVSGHDISLRQEKARLPRITNGLI